FTLPGVAALYCSSFAQGFSHTNRRAAARALLRCNVHNNGDHFNTQTPGGLHLSFFQSKAESGLEEPWMTDKTFKAETAGDIFDAVAMQDCLDGGISIVLHCCGVEATPDLAPEKLAVDLYITPRELYECDDKVSKPTALL
ncbi:hypothetical protein BV22DRAFT_983298, partial [Leucogyrophana mollusca]